MALIIDFETTGLPERQSGSGTFMPHYADLEKYKNARAVQFTMMKCTSNLQQVDIKDYIIKSDGFIIENSNFHGITQEMSNNHGVSFYKIVDDLEAWLNDVDMIIAHNADFDINILKSELYRHRLYDMIYLIESKNIICTMKMTRRIVNVRNSYGIKFPSLAELYLFAMNKPIENAHNSKYDVIQLHEAIKKLYDNNLLKL